MTVEEAKELKVGDRVRLESGRLCEVFAVYERGIDLVYWPVPSGHSGLFEWERLAKAEKL